jgi:hypothetical protein
MAPGCVWHERYMWHEPDNFAGSLRPEGFIQPGSHVEHPEIKKRIQNLLDICGMTVQLTTIAPQPATVAELTCFHSKDYVAHRRDVTRDRRRGGRQCLVLEQAHKDRINAWIVGLSAGRLEDGPILFASELTRVLDDGDNMRELPIISCPARAVPQPLADCISLPQTRLHRGHALGRQRK